MRNISDIISSNFESSNKKNLKNCRVQEQFKGFDGHQLLSMKRSDLLAAFGRVEGDRLEGQITICRKTTGFGTASSELRDILVKARKRTETMRADAVDDTTTSLA